MSKKVTLKDIACRCEVSPTVVSAVINGRQGRISCSPSKRQQILQTTKELNYHVNIFARTMKMQQVPIVGMMLHCDAQHMTNPGRPSTFVEYAHARLTLAFNRNNLEVVFIPYFSEAEQLTRLDKLNGYGLIGGIVTNIIPESHQRICRYLAESGLPYMVLGKPLADDIYCTYSISTALEKKVMEIAAAQECQAVFQVIANSGHIEFRRYPFVGSYMWITPPQTVDQIDPDDDRVLYAVHGVHTLSEVKKQGIRLKRILMVESEIFQNLINQEEYDTLVISENYIFSYETEYTVASVCNWMGNGVHPPCREKIFNDTQKHIIKYINKG